MANVMSTSLKSWFMSQKSHATNFLNVFWSLTHVRKSLIVLSLGRQSFSFPSVLQSQSSQSSDRQSLARLQSDSSSSTQVSQTHNNKHLQRSKDTNILIQIKFK